MSEHVEDPSCERAIAGMTKDFFVKLGEILGRTIRSHYHPTDFKMIADAKVRLDYLILFFDKLHEEFKAQPPGLFGNRIIGYFRNIEELFKPVVEGTGDGPVLSVLDVSDLDFDLEEIIGIWHNRDITKTAQYGWFRRLLG